MHECLESEIVHQLDKSQQEAFYKMAENSLKSEFSQLMLLIQKKQWQSAIEQNHLLKSTVILIGCNKLLGAIEAVENDEELLKKKDFLSYLNTAYGACLNIIIEKQKSL